MLVGTYASIKGMQCPRCLETNAELEIELGDLRAQRADMFEKYEVERTEANQLNGIQEEIDRCGLIVVALLGL